MRLYNTLTRSLEDFTPESGAGVGIYQCGPTVYWSQQLGNLRAYILVDFFVRSLELQGYKPTLVRNYTDVGHLSGDNEGDADKGVDRMEKASKREALTPIQIANKYISEFEDDISLLRIKKPQVTPRATDHIQEMIAMVQVLLDKGYAYQTELAIYFDISKKEDYTKLSGQSLDDLTAGMGHGDVADKNKKNSADFSVWFFKAGTHADALQTWKNPFSQVEGFPGWHIECSAMSKKYLGNTFDIHIGGVEHIPIHHTNEIAQSEATNDAPLANFWLHYEHLLANNKKMSKSAGTAFLLSDVITRGYSPLDLRYFYLQAHYRSKQNFTWEALDAARTARKRLIEKVSVKDKNLVIPEFKEEFLARLAEDFNTPHALGLVKDVLMSDFSEEEKSSTISYFDEVFDIGINNKENIQKTNITSDAQKLLDERAQARADKNWTKADELRDKLYELGYTVKDSVDGQIIL